MRTVSPVLCIADCAAVPGCLLTDQSDALLLPLGLFRSAAATALHILIARQTKRGKETEK